MEKYNEMPYYVQTSRIIHIDGRNVEVFASEWQDLDKMCEKAKTFLARPVDSSPTLPADGYLSSTTNWTSTNTYSVATDTSYNSWFSRRSSTSNY